MSSTETLIHVYPSDGYVSSAINSGKYSNLFHYLSIESFILKQIKSGFLSMLGIFLLMISGCYIDRSGLSCNIKMLSYQYRKSHCGNETVIRSFLIYSGNSYTGNMTSLYWISPMSLYAWLSTRPRYLQYVSNGDITILLRSLNN